MEKTTAVNPNLDLSHDRIASNELVMTHKLISGMLGVHREGVTLVAGKLQAAGLIQYQRGIIQVLDRKRLEEQVCECYPVVRPEFERLLGLGEFIHQIN
jgi:hypothetical protein